MDILISNINNVLLVSIIILIIFMFLLLPMIFYFARNRLINYRKEDQSLIQFRWNLDSKILYLYNLENSDIKIKNIFNNSDSFFFDEMESIFSKTSFDKVKSMFANIKEKKIDFPYEIKVNLKVNNFKQNILFNIVFEKEENIYGVAYFGFNVGEVNENTIRSKIFDLRPQISTKNYRDEYSVKLSKFENFDLLLINYKDIVKKFEIKNNIYMMINDINTKLIKWCKENYKTQLFWIDDDLSLIIFLPSFKSEDKIKLLKYFEKEIAKILSKHKLLIKDGIYISYLANQSIKENIKNKDKPLDELKIIILKLSFLYELSKQNDIYIKEYTHEIEEQRIKESKDKEAYFEKILSSKSNLLIKKYNLIDIDKIKRVGNSIYQDNLLIKIFTENLFDQEKLDILYQLIVKDIKSNIKKKNKNSIYCFSVHINYIALKTKQQIQDMLGWIKTKVRINIYWDNFNEINLDDVSEKINFIRNIGLNNKTVFMIGITKMHLIDINVPILIKLKPDFVTIEGKEMESLSQNIAKEVVLKQWGIVIENNTDIKNKTNESGFFIINNPINAEQIEDLKKFNFKYIETTEKEWNDLYFHKIEY